MFFVLYFILHMIWRDRAYTSYDYVEFEWLAHDNFQFFTDVILRPSYLRLLYPNLYVYTYKEKQTMCFRLRSGKPGFNPRSRHIQDFKNGTWYLLA